MRRFDRRKGIHILSKSLHPGAWLRSLLPRLVLSFVAPASYSLAAIVGLGIRIFLLPWFSLRASPALPSLLYLAWFVCCLFRWLLTALLRILAVCLLLRPFRLWSIC